MRQIPKLEELIAKGHMKKMTGKGDKHNLNPKLYKLVKAHTNFTYFGTVAKG
jgi:hypothetical protein